MASQNVPAPENEQNDAPEMKDPLQPGTFDIDERMSTLP
jgi:hypothetical protein